MFIQCANNDFEHDENTLFETCRYENSYMLFRSIVCMLTVVAKSRIMNTKLSRMLLRTEWICTEIISICDDNFTKRKNIAFYLTFVI